MNETMDYRIKAGEDDKEYLEMMKSLENRKMFVTIKANGMIIKTTNPEKFQSLKGEYIITTNRNVSVPTRRGKKIENPDGTYTISTKDYELLNTILENIWQ